MKIFGEVKFRPKLTSTTLCRANSVSIFFQGYEVLSKYVALYAANLIKDNNTLKALDLFCRYGAPANPQVRTPKQPFCSGLTVCKTHVSSNELHTWNKLPS